MFSRRASLGIAVALVAGWCDGWVGIPLQAASPVFQSVPLAHATNGPPGFTLLAPDTTGVHFTNRLSDARAAENQIRLNGSGVAAGDIDGDGWCDLYFCGLESHNVLYRNLGGWRFLDITAAAGVACDGQYNSGTTMADVDGDGDLDLLVGGIGTGVRLFLNDGRGVFKEAGDSGLPRTGGVTSLALADVDGDGDLDLYVCFYRTTTVRSTGLELLRVGNRRMLKPEQREDYELTPEGRLIEHGEPDMLLLNDGQGRFKAVSWTAGKFLDEAGAALSKGPRDWTLSAMFRDVNRDGHPDLYVCGDFHSPDHLWLNDGRGGFRAAPKLALRHTSTFSMSVDFADVNRDGWDDFFVADMLGRDRARRMMQAAGADPVRSEPGNGWDRPQNDQSVLQINRGDGTFAELAYLAGLEANDWAWSAVFLDVDLDGFEDLLCNTGHAFDTQDLDADARIAAMGPMPREKVPGKLLLYPRLPMAKLAFRNRGNLTFEETGALWGFHDAGVAHGLALADLDNDGDLDVVVNNLNAPAGLYRNHAAAPRIAVRLQGRPPNTQAIGARVSLRGHPFDQEQEIIAGGRYLSGADPLRVFAVPGPGPYTLEVRWPRGNISRSLATNDCLYVVTEPEEAKGVEPASEPAPPLFEDLRKKLGHCHMEAPSDDLSIQPLLPQQLSRSGPGVAWVDLDGDGWDDLVIGGSRGGSVGVFQNLGQGEWLARSNDWLKGNLTAATTGLAVAGLADGRTRLFAGLAKPASSTESSPVLASFQTTETPSVDWLGSAPFCPGPVTLADYDGDGDLDIFVGGAFRPGRYPESPGAGLWRQEENGRFSLDEAGVKVLADVGMVCGAVFGDLDCDGRPELILACDWGPMRILKFGPGGLRDESRALGLESTRGRWRGVALGDFDGDGRLDFVGANWGLNSRWRATAEHPYRIYYGDFDHNSTLDLLEAAYDPQLRAEAPQRDLATLSAAMPFLNEKFRSFSAYGSARLADILGAEPEKVPRVEACQLASCVFLNRGDHFEVRPLPLEAQWSAASGVAVADFDGDGHEDLFLTQNRFDGESLDTRQDAGRGLVLLGDGQGRFRPLPGSQSGVLIYGEQRGVAVGDYDRDGRPDVVVGQNGGETVLLRNQGGKPGLRLRLQGPPRNPLGVGAQLRLRGKTAVGHVCEVHAGGGLGSQDSLVQILHLAEGPVSVEVRWPGGPWTNVPLVPGQKEITLSWKSPLHAP